MTQILNYKGVKYELSKDYWKGEFLNDSIDFQYEQLKYCLDTGDFTTFENRVTNMTAFGGIVKIE